MQIRSVGIDLGKTTFHLVALGTSGKVLVKKKFSQKQLLAFTANMQISLIGYTYDSTGGNPEDGSVRRVTTRVVSSDGTSTGEKTWTYSIGYNSSANVSTASVTDPVGDIHTEGFRQSFLACGLWDGCDVLYIPSIPISVLSKDTDSASHLLKEVDRVEGYDSTQYDVAYETTKSVNNPRVLKETTTLGGSTQSPSLRIRTDPSET